MSRTKIVATIGPSSSSPGILAILIATGVDFARLNFSHGTYASHADNIATIRRIAADQGRIVGILQDLMGPRIRVGDLSQPVHLNEGERVLLTSESMVGQGNVLPVIGADLAIDVQPGNNVLIADGQIELKVRQVSPPQVVAEVVVGGLVESHKGVNVPGVTLRIPSFTDKDRADLDFGLSQGVDWVATSFVRNAADLEIVRSHMKKVGADVPIMAKIEKHEAVDRFDEILAAADGIMVARGDLGIEIPAEEVPIIQKSIISRCNRAGKPVVTATQMLNSMIENPRPTRAEASDVANAILDGTDAVMLSGETAMGKYPVESVETMGRIAARAEASFPYGKQLDRARKMVALSATEAISQATVEIAAELPARAIITLTHSGYTARQVAKYRPVTPILAFTPRQETQRRLAMTWGVRPLLVDGDGSTDEMIGRAIRAANAAGLVARGDSVVITAGVPVGGAGRTNLLRIETV